MRFDQNTLTKWAETILFKRAGASLSQRSSARWASETGTTGSAGLARKADTAEEAIWSIEDAGTQEMPACAAAK